ncbi:sulfotransferase family protein [Streptomyces sp. 8N706]|uniref:sulfotransferase family protein n=1 Tax=Streptomyces sp. 8N706 TaxID=3457416 RepID=UPI003FCEEF2D
MTATPRPRPEPVFVTGTGRCGSTLVSDLLRDHPAVLSLSELFLHLTDTYRLPSAAFPEGKLTAAEFQEILAARHRVNNLLIEHRVAPKETLYPLTGEARFGPATGVPAILMTTLPHLSDDPDALFDEITEAVAGFPDASAADHYTRLFGWLCARLDKRIWAERSGGSLILATRYQEMFPDAKFVHVLRDGRDCALSMSRHHGFRMAAVVMAMGFTLGEDPYAAEDLSRLDLDFLPEELHSLLPDRFDPAAFRRYDIPASLFGAYWADEMERGMQALSSVPEDRILHLWYEDLLAEPAECVGQLIDFIGPQYADPAWVERSVARIGTPTVSWSDLPDGEREELDDACRRGFETLARHGFAPRARHASALHTSTAG